MAIDREKLLDGLQERMWPAGSAESDEKLQAQNVMLGEIIERVRVGEYDEQVEALKATE